LGTIGTIGIPDQPMVDYPVVMMIVVTVAMALLAIFVGSSTMY